VTATLDGTLVAVGNRDLMATHEVTGVDRIAQRSPAGQPLIYVSLGGHAIGAITVPDEVKASTPDAVAALHADGVDIVMATGDASGPAQALATSLSIDSFHSGVKPDDNLAIVEQSQGEGHLVAMAGDGMNDAPGLAQADIGIDLRVVR
jgi:P-type E1-E2 ATPase